MAEQIDSNDKPDVFDVLATAVYLASVSYAI